MAIRKFKPTSPARRFMTVSALPVMPSMAASGTSIASTRIR